LSKTWVQFKLDIRNLLKIFYYELSDLIEYLEEKNDEKLLDLDQELKGF
tara:strand:- start:2326 stop:2472 length:147 start_codon:yes stop_codon:yes gene_type:complete